MTDRIDKLVDGMHAAVSGYVQRSLAEALARVDILEKQLSERISAVDKQIADRVELALGAQVAPAVKSYVDSIRPELRGEQGPQGERGIQGTKGDPGIQGEIGPEGQRGEPGPAGKDGVDGKDGAPGRDGLDGKDGIDGKDGRDGVDGKDGAPGIKGIDGKDGRDGRDANDGKDGKDGLPGKDGRDGIDGKDGFSPTDLDTELLPDGRTLRLKLIIGDRVESRDVRLPIPIYRGTWSPIMKSDQYDMWTYHNEVWSALIDQPTEPPSVASKQWKLAVRKGRDGKPIKLNPPE